MKFILVNGRTPRPQLSVRGVVSPSGQATCEKSQRGSPTAITGATPVKKICQARRPSADTVDLKTAKGAGRRQNFK
jgi:hypothetical protein